LVTRVNTVDIEFDSLADARAAGFTVVDVRDSAERMAEPLPGASLHLPMSKLLGAAAELDQSLPYLFVCTSGRRSVAAADLLRSHGFLVSRSLRGGVRALKTPA
jgi:rhodanese-related sulfurtransferase